MRIIDGGEGWTWAKPEDVQPLSSAWKKIWWTLGFSAFLLVLIGLWGWAMAFVTLIALHEALKDGLN